jgi:hypothetical protein
MKLHDTAQNIMDSVPERLTVSMFSSIQMLLSFPGGFFIRAEPVSSKFLTHVLMA